MVDRNAMLARIDLIAATLGLPNSETAFQTRDDEAIIDFAIRHRQNLDWVILGDVRGMIMKMTKAA